MSEKIISTKYWTPDLSTKTIDFGLSKVHINFDWKVLITEFYDSTYVDLWDFNTSESRQWVKDLNYPIGTSTWTHFLTHEFNFMDCRSQ